MPHFLHSTRRKIKHLFRWRTSWKMPKRVKRPTENQVLNKLVRPGDDWQDYDIPIKARDAEGGAMWLGLAMAVNHTAQDFADVAYMIESLPTIDTRPTVEQVIDLLDEKGRFEVWNSGRMEYAPSENAMAIADRLNELKAVRYSVTPGDVLVAQIRKKLRGMP